MANVDTVISCAALAVGASAFVAPYLTARLKAKPAAEKSFAEQFRILADELRTEVDRLKRVIEDNEQRCKVQLARLRKRATATELRLLHRIRGLEKLLRGFGVEPPIDEHAGPPAD